MGLLVYVLASVSCAIAPDAGLLIGCLAAAGPGRGGLSIVIARAVVRDLYDGLEMARFFSTLLLVSSLAPVVAPILGGQVLRFTAWRGVFLVLAVIGVALTALVWRRLPETLPPSGGAAGVCWAPCSSCAACSPTGSSLSYVMVNGFAYGALFSYIAASPFVIQGIYGASPQTFSLLYGLNSLGMMIVGRVNGKLLVGRVRLDRALGVGLSVIAVAGTVLLLVAQGVFGDAGTVPVACCLFVMISALGLVLPNTNALALMRTPHAAGSASALVGTSCSRHGRRRHPPGRHRLNRERPSPWPPSRPAAPSPPSPPSCSCAAPGGACPPRKAAPESHGPSRAPPLVCHGSSCGPLNRPGPAA